MRWICNICGYMYDEENGDPDNGIEPGTKFEDLPEDFVCPLCTISSSCTIFRSKTKFRASYGVSLITEI